MALGIPGGVDGQGPDGFPVSTQGSPHVGAGDQEGDPFTPIGPAHPDVVEAALVAQRHFPGLVDFVVTDPIALDVDAGLGGPGLGPGDEDTPRGFAPKGAVWPHLVVVLDEAIELGLEFGDGGGRVLGSEVFLTVW